MNRIEWNKSAAPVRITVEDPNSGAKFVFDGYGEIVIGNDADDIDERMNPLPLPPRLVARLSAFSTGDIQYFRPVQRRLPEEEHFNRSGREQMEP